MGGELEIIARFPGQTVRITQFEALDPENRLRLDEDIAKS
jgi:hypothetical protein